MGTGWVEHMGQMALLPSRELNARWIEGTDAPSTCSIQHVTIISLLQKITTARDHDQ